jgi:hypothetical protein
MNLNTCRRTISSFAPEFAPERLSKYDFREVNVLTQRTVKACIYRSFGPPRHTVAHEYGLCKAPYSGSNPDAASKVLLEIDIGLPQCLPLKIAYD